MSDSVIEEDTTILYYFSEGTQNQPQCLDVSLIPVKEKTEKIEKKRRCFLL